MMAKKRIKSGGMGSNSSLGSNAPGGATPSNQTPASAPDAPPTRETVVVSSPGGPPSRDTGQQSTIGGAPPTRDPMTDILVEMQQQTDEIARQIERIETTDAGSWVYLSAPLTSTSWDGDAHSTTAKTLIDLSAVFGVPDYVKAIKVAVTIRDSGSAGGDYYLILGPTNSAGLGMPISCGGLTNDIPARAALTVPCDANGDIYYQIAASGSGTMDIWMSVWGYMI
jgi:hypothetical protein